MRNEIELLAKFLWQVHAHCLTPFYGEHEERSSKWKYLEETTDDKEKVDKNFFRKIARHIFAELKKNQQSKMKAAATKKIRSRKN